jgi:integrator complex subunit 4
LVYKSINTIYFTIDFNIFNILTDASVLVLIFNAALHCPSMHALFTEHASKHYHYLRDTMPHLVPRLRPALTNASGIKMEDMDNEENRDQRGRQFLEKMVTGIENARPGGRVHTQLLEAAAIDLDCLAEMDHHMEGAARFTALYIRCLLLLKSVLKEFCMSSTTSISTTPILNTSNNVFILLQHTQKYVFLIYSRRFRHY